MLSMLKSRFNLEIGGGTEWLQHIRDAVGATSFGCRDGTRDCCDKGEDTCSESEFRPCQPPSPGLPRTNNSIPSNPVAIESWAPQITGTMASCSSRTIHLGAGEKEWGSIPPPIPSPLRRTPGF